MKNLSSILTLLSSTDDETSGNGSGYQSIEARRDEIYQEAVDRGFFTKEEFDKKFRGQFLDNYGQDSLACYISCVFEKPEGVFVSANPKLLERRMQLQLRFETKIVSIDEAIVEPRGQVLMMDASVLTEILIEEQVRKSAELATEGKYKEAIEEADAGLVIDQENLRLRTIRGTAYASTEQMEEAKEDLELVIRCDDNCPPELVHNLGCVYCALGDRDKARELFHQALRMRPDYDLPNKMLEQMEKEEKEKGESNSKEEVDQSEE